MMGLVPAHALDLLAVWMAALAQANPASGPLATPSGAPWRPFLDPVIIHDHWYLLIFPMAFLLSLGYKAVRCHDMRRYWRAVIAMTLQVIAAMVALGAGFYVLIEFVLPRIAP